MKNIKYLTLALVLALVFLSLTACSSNPVKGDFKEYINNNANTVFIPENAEIVKTYSDAINTQDENVFIPILDTLPAKNTALLEKLKAYTPKTTEVQELHKLFINAVEIRGEAYNMMLDAISTNDDSITDAATAKLTESDAKFNEFQTKQVAMMKDLGLVVPGK